MNNAFNWRTGPSVLAKEFQVRNTKPGKQPPIVLPGSSKCLPLKSLERAK